ncbi:MAG: SURF1 family protein [Sphingomonadaceae bacterium]|nr:SURF1 family protein [Sphingomonadaceae bacterium]MCP5384670.1 SURF1 family protein [Altererythrobacter sp.]MCP5393863.1 SURF1 family protein [Sphingomonadaceae bacterium]
MNWRGIPIISTAIVLAAVAVMTGLGFWQLDRLDQKEALIARYKAAPTDAARIDYPAADQIEQELYRKVRAECAEVASILGVAGNNSLGVSGFSHVADCTLKGGEEAKVALGWSRNPQSPDWQGGEVLGILAPGGKIVADPPLAELGPLAKPDPADLPNNHLAYAGQWFFFALTALVIYILALRRRRRED